MSEWISVKDRLPEEEGKLMEECVYKTTEGYCTLHSDGIGHFEYCVEGPYDDEEVENRRASDV